MKKNLSPPSTSKSPASIGEVESPVLYLDSLGLCYCRPSKSILYSELEWACIGRLSTLFELDDSMDRICFVAKPKADRSTYKVQLDTNGFDDLVKPIRAVIYAPLSRWLKKQIAAGRPHIGVRIVK